ncbi:MAG: hypothetical protein AAF739_16905 [Pseudomonadota bacterium]
MTGRSKRLLDSAIEIRRLRERIDLLEEELRQLRESLKPPETLRIQIADAFRLSRVQASILATLFGARSVTTERLMMLVDTVTTGNPDRDLLNIVRGHVSGLRKALSPHCIEIESVYGDFYRLPAASKTRIIRLLNKVAA